MATKSINPQEFWDLYFPNRFLRLSRKNGYYVGEIFAEPEQGQSPLGLLRDDAKVEIGISLASLREYDYSGDARFTRITQQSSIKQAYEAVIAGTYPFRDPAPFGKQRMAELLTQIRAQFVHGEAARLSLSEVERTLKNLVKRHTPDLNQPIAALAWFLGERHERSSSSVLLMIVENSSIAPYSRHQIHFTAVDAAFSALWKVNDKTPLWTLLEIMRVTSESGCRKIASLFERLLSTSEMLSFGQCGNAYLDATFWKGELERGRNYTPKDWDRYDANSLFWELRYLAAKRISNNDSETLQKLAGDEVATVRAVAAHRLTQNPHG